MAKVDGKDGFSQLTRLNVTDLLYLRGGPLAGSATEIGVQEASDFNSGPDGKPESDKVYVIDGDIDMGTTPIIVPEGGITINGYGFNISRLFSSQPNYKMFINDTGTYAGDIFLDGLTVTVDGAGSMVFDVDNQGNSDAMEFNNVNWTDCVDLGVICDYRQMLTRNNAWINGEKGWTIDGTWAGLAILDSIMLLFNNPVGYTLFSDGGSLIFTSSIRSNLNALNVPADWTYFDFSPANITPDEGVLLAGVRTNATDAVPNLPGTDQKAYYTDCRGIRNTYVGSQYEITASAATVIGVVDTLVKMAGTTTYSDEQHFQSVTDNAMLYISSVEREFKISGVLSFTGTNNNEVAVQIRQWDDSASSYIEIGPEYIATLNGGPAGTRGENVAFQGFAIMSENDRIEVWIKNKTAANNITASVGGSLEIEER